MSTPKPTLNDKVFHVAFDTKSQAGYLKSVKITIENDIIDLDETVRIDLVDHPLYKDLYRYCLANKPRKLS